MTIMTDTNSAVNITNSRFRASETPWIEIYFLFTTNTIPRHPKRRRTEYFTLQYMSFQRLPTFVDVYRHFVFVFVANYAIAKKETLSTDRNLETIFTSKICGEFSFKKTYSLFR